MTSLRTRTPSALAVCLCCALALSAFSGENANEQTEILGKVTYDPPRGEAPRLGELALVVAGERVIQKGLSVVSEAYVERHTVQVGEDDSFTLRVSGPASVEFDQKLEPAGDPIDVPWEGKAALRIDPGADAASLTLNLKRIPIDVFEGVVCQFFLCQFFLCLGFFLCLARLGVASIVLPICYTSSSYSRAMHGAQNWQACDGS